MLSSWSKLRILQVLRKKANNILIHSKYFLSVEQQNVLTPGAHIETYVDLFYEINLITITIKEQLRWALILQVWGGDHCLGRTIRAVCPGI